MESKKSVFEVLNAINCNEHTEKKNGLTYLSWAWAWQMVKQNFPNATYKVYETEEGMNYFTDGRTCWVKTGVTIEGIEHIEYLPVMDFRNASIGADRVTSFDVNKSIQRSLTKACARHGLGLYIYAGEDLPDTDNGDAEAPAPSVATARKTAKGKKPAASLEPYKPVSHQAYWKIIENYVKGIPSKSGEDYRTAWIKMTNASQEHIDKFNIDVDNYRATL